MKQATAVSRCRVRAAVPDPAVRIRIRGDSGHESTHTARRGYFFIGILASISLNNCLKFGSAHLM